MREATRDTVTPGGSSAPPGARETSHAARRAPSGRLSPERNTPLAGSPWIVAAILVAALVAYAAIAADVVEGGRLSDLDQDLSAWIARSMPAVAEWLARVLSWIGGWVGTTLIVAGVVVWLVRRGEAALGGLLVVVALGQQVVNTVTKDGYDRARPTAGSPIDLPSSSSFPSGHAMTGIAVFGLLGLLLARELHTRSAQVAAIIGGFALGALIGASRVVLNVHFLSDVLGGAALGLAWLAACLLGATAVATLRRRYAEPS